MSTNARIRNGMAPSAGSGGAGEGDIRGIASDILSGGGVVDLKAGHLLVHQSVSPDMNVIVDAGVGYIPNASFDELDSDQVRFWDIVVNGTSGSRTVAIGSNSSGSTRYDSVCLKMDTGVTPNSTASNIVTIVVVAGTPGSGVPPATPSNHLLLATVEVINGASTIPNAKITDQRVQVAFQNRFKANRRVTYAASATTLTPNIDTTDLFDVDDLAHNTTIAAPTGTPADGQVILIRIKDAGVSKTIAWNSIYRVFSTYLPSATTVGKAFITGAMYNLGANKWDVLATQQET